MTAPPEAAQTPRFCSVCGNLLGEGAAFCASCGTAVGGPPRNARADASYGPTVDLAGTRYELASVWRRFGASLIDGIAWSTVTQVFWVRMQSGFGAFGGPRTDAEATDLLAQVIHTYLTWGLLLTALGWLAFVAFEAYGWSPGRAALGIRILRQDGHRPGFVHGLARYGTKTLSALALGLGYLWALWDPHRQTWHDKLASTYVIQLGSQAGGQPGTSALTLPAGPAPLAVSTGAWVWAVITVAFMAAFVAGSLALAAWLPADGPGLERFFRERFDGPPARPIGPRTHHIEYAPPARPPGA